MLTPRFILIMFLMFASPCPACKATKVRDGSGRLPLKIAADVGVSEAIKSMVFEANPEVLKGVTLHEVVDPACDWGESAVKSLLKAA